MYEARQFSVALLQLPANANGSDRLQDAVTALRAAAAAPREGGLICVLPELFRAPYFCQTMDADQFDLAEPIPGPATGVLGALAAELQIVIVASLFERIAPGLCANTTAVLDSDGTLAGTYRKSHIPCDSQYEEKFYFTPGDTGFRVIPTQVARLGILICWDQWFPEAARLTAMQGADILLYPTAIGAIDGEGAEEHARQLDAWQTIQRGHAIANGVFVAAVNRCGREPGPNGGIEFWGHSFCVGPQGEWLVRADHHPQTIVAVCDRSRVEHVRRWWPFFRDRRIDLYGGLTERWLAAPKEQK